MPLPPDTFPLRRAATASCAAIRCTVRLGVWLRQRVRGALLALVLFAPLAAQATNYVLPGKLPGWCYQSSSTRYTCPFGLSLDWNDSISVRNPNTTLAVSGTLWLNGNEINTSSTASGFVITADTIAGNNYANVNAALSATGNISLGYNSNVIGDITAGGYFSTQWYSSVTGSITASSISDSGGSDYIGNLVATSGYVSLGSGDTVTGSINAAGSINLSSGNSVSGDVVSSGSWIALRSSGTTVSGSVNAYSSVLLESGATVGANVTSTAGQVQINSSGASVGGNVLAASDISLGSGDQVLGSVTSTGGNVILYSSSATVGKCVTASSSKSIYLGWAASVGGVCCLSGGTCGTSCVSNNSGQSMPSACQGSSNTCIVDSFASGTLNSSLWNALSISGGFTPAVANVSGSPRIRMTTNAGNESTMLQLKKWFPGAGNKIVVDFDYYVYGGSGADGLSVVFSDASVAPQPGGFGGSLGYASRDGSVNGFAGGWLAVGLDEYGNFSNNTEGRPGYPAGWSAPSGANSSAGFRANAVAVRGSGSGLNGYALLASTGTLTTPLWRSSNTSATSQHFRITIDHTNNVNAYVTVERDVSGGGSNYTTLIPKFDVLASGSGQAAVPQNWLVSFAGSTGTSNNYREIANLRICAPYVTDPGNSANAGAFDCLETGANVPWVATARHPLYTKLAGADFAIDIAALKSDGTLESNYVAAGGSSKYVKVELFDDTTPAATCSAYANPVAAQTVAFVSGNPSSAAGRTRTGAFSVSRAYAKLRCRVKECTDGTCGSFTSQAPACSTDQFAVRPGAVSLMTSASAAAPSATASPVIKAGAVFSLQAITSTSASDAYAGSLLQDGTKLSAQISTQATTQQSGGTVGTLTPTSLIANAAAVSATYSEVGYLYLAPGAFLDDSFTAVDSAQGDCVTDTTGNANLAVSVNAAGQYGCHIGNTAAVSLGRFIPDHFKTTTIEGCSAAPFTYSGQPFTVRIDALNATSANTLNYANAFANGVTLSDGSGSPSPGGFGATGSIPGTAFAGAAGAGQGFASVNTPTYTFSTTPTAPRTISVRATDNDAVSSAGFAEGNAHIRSGRLWLANAYGSELLDLPLTLEAQYWNAGGYYVTNRDDVCTSLAGSSIALSGYQQNLSACETYFVPATAQTAANGKFPLRLKAPGAGNSGSVALTVNTGAAASGQTCVSPTVSSATAGNVPWFGNVPTARATFGVRKTPLIYRRETY
ncbi:hypothetical protein GH865_05420 [Rhodocyclus tenuis]|uniref:DUF6701 domain-containing protein n=1 Tax=Rhodocyclus gracilis TaxID=2929842 RepID=UPI001298DA30|nr:DUF6701 domain-containing protein [Rhodocyclus gracilis]MRD72690.1 hypothetical protein [Rhodocyclus gracilis]